MLSQSDQVMRAALLFTHARWQGVVPLCQVVWDALAADGGGAVQDVAWVAFKLYQGADGKVVTEAFPKARLWD